MFRRPSGRFQGSWHKSSEMEASDSNEQQSGEPHRDLPNVANASVLLSTPSSPRLAARFKAEINPGQKDSVSGKSPCFSFIEQEKEEDKPETILQMRENDKWRKASLAVALASLITSLLFSAALFTASVKISSSAVLATALDTFFEVFTALIIAWRFWNNSNRKNEKKRERQGSIAFGIAFVVKALIIITFSYVNLENKSSLRHSKVMWATLLVFCFSYCVLGATELWIASKIRSSVLVTLCIGDVLTGGLMFVVALDQAIIDHFPSLWYLDNALAMGISFVILSCGIKILIDIFVFNKLPFQMFN